MTTRVVAEPPNDTSPAGVPEPDLLPCPFCESDAAVVGYGPYIARCKRCTASLGPLFTLTPNEAIAAWNRRATRSADTDALVAALREDAERWRALMSSPRLHFMGCAGFDIKGPKEPGTVGTPLATATASAKPDEQLHFGMEFWSEFSWRSPEEAAEYPDRFEREFMTVYVDEMRRRAALQQHEEKKL